MQNTTSASPETLARRKIGCQIHSPTCFRSSGAPRTTGKTTTLPVDFHFIPPFRYQRCNLSRYRPNRGQWQPAFRSPKYRVHPHNSGLFQLRSSFKFASFPEVQTAKTSNFIPILAPSLPRFSHINSHMTSHNNIFSLLRPKLLTINMNQEILTKSTPKKSTNSHNNRWGKSSPIRAQDSHFCESVGGWPNVSRRFPGSPGTICRQTVALKRNFQGHFSLCDWPLICIMRAL